MNGVLNIFLLLSVPVLPLLLVFPALRSRLPLTRLWPCHFALLPAIILLFMPVTITVDLPWLLLGTTLGFDGTSRWLLAVTVLLWFIAASLLRTARAPSANDPVAKAPASNNRYINFFLLTMAGSLGATLVTDLMTFFVFSTLLGYGFFGLLVSTGDDTTRRGARSYLVLLVLADLALFEAILIAAATTGSLDFESLPSAMVRAMTQSESPALYLSMVLAGFALKTGLWPAHFWLALVFRSTQPAVAMLLPGAVIALAMLGVVRWLPLGEVNAPELGLVVQAIGGVAMLYAATYIIFGIGLKKTRLKMLPVYATILATGLFFTAVGAGLANPVAWNSYETSALYYTASLGFGLAVLVIICNWRPTRKLDPATSLNQAQDSELWIERSSGFIVTWIGNIGVETLPRWRAWCLLKASSLWHAVYAMQNMLDVSEQKLYRWTIAITLFLLLGIAMVFVIITS